VDRQGTLPESRLPSAVIDYLRDTNPWWAGRPGRVLPKFRRWPFEIILRKLRAGLAPALILRGPRQVGKTTLQEQVIQHLLTTEGVDPRRILRVQFDDIPSLRGLQEPILSIARWFEANVLTRSFNESAHDGQPSYIFLDEAQNLKDWAPQVKALVDHHSLKAMITGSSALRIMAGHDSLAGRVGVLDLGPLLLREIAALRHGDDILPAIENNGLESLTQREFWAHLADHGRRHEEARNRAFAAYSERGGYPMAQAHPEVPWPEVADQLNETVIQRAIHHDLRLGQRGQKRDPDLLEEVFRLACRYAGQAPGQSVFLPELRQSLNANVGWQRVVSYLSFLDSSLLIRLVRPLELRLKKNRGPSKICLSDHALRASWLHENVPLDPESLRAAPHLADLGGRLAESVVGYFLSTIPHLDLNHFPQRGAEPEVDFVLTIGLLRIPLEVKFRQRIDYHEDTRGLRAFMEKTANNAPFGVLVTMHDDVEIPDPRIVPVALPSLLLMR